MHAQLYFEHDRFQNGYTRDANEVTAVRRSAGTAPIDR